VSFLYRSILRSFMVSNFRVRPPPLRALFLLRGPLVASKSSLGLRIWWPPPFMTVTHCSVSLRDRILMRIALVHPLFSMTFAFFSPFVLYSLLLLTWIFFRLIVFVVLRVFFLPITRSCAVTLLNFLFRSLPVYWRFAGVGRLIFSS